MLELKRARDAGGGNLRGHHLVQAQRHIAGLDPMRHGTLMQHLQAHVVAMGGRGGDTRIAHVTPGEVVVPESMLTPDVVDILRRAAKEKCIDPSRFVVGSGRNVINPNTGQMEFDDDGEDDADDGFENSQSPLPDPSTESNQYQTCTFPAYFSGVGPNQATGKGALGIFAPNDSVAINPSIFDLPYNTIPEREASQKLLEANLPNIRVSAPGLSDYLTGATTFSVSDVGNKNIRNSAFPRFDIYRFATDEDANSFGKPKVLTTVTGIPKSWSCP
ncbi:MAG: hypothetical protein EPO08_12630 [Rhodospirillaceae bacterium]|nr:MAG: hypothetical protein EPO08_12630 [Rhodospirillaceae bacterium]